MSNDCTLQGGEQATEFVPRASFILCQASIDQSKCAPAHNTEWCEIGKPAHKQPINPYTPAVRHLFSSFSQCQQLARGSPFGLCAILWLVCLPRSLSGFFFRNLGWENPKTKKKLATSLCPRPSRSTDACAPWQATTPPMTLCVTRPVLSGLAPDLYVAMHRFNPPLHSCCCLKIALYRF